jgi:tetratricopeptide (TPR) repeat protein
VDEAIQFFQEHVRANPQHAAAQQALAEALEARGRLEEAAALYRKLIESEPDALEPYVALGSMYRRQGRTRDAAASFEAALRRFPDSEEIHHHRAKAYMEIPDLPRSIAAYKEIRKRWPQSWVATANLAWILATAPDPRFRDGKEAVALADVAVQATSGREPQALNTLAAAYAQAGRFEDALRTANQALQAAQAAGPQGQGMVPRIQQLIELYTQGKAYPYETAAAPRKAS